MWACAEADDEDWGDPTPICSRPTPVSVEQINSAIFPWAILYIGDAIAVNMLQLCGTDQNKKQFKSARNK